jgi:transmembrane sensor
MKHPIPSPETLHNYLAGICTETERQLVNDWYKHLDSDHAVSEDTDEESLYGRIQTSIAEQEIRKSREVLFAVYRSYAIRIAAVLCIGLGILYFFYSPPFESQPDKQETAAKQVQFYNHDKKITRYTLPDSTLVWLNPGAQISYLKSFTKRDVQFSGEAFFDVKPDKNRPFTIYSGELKTRVLGTSFNVRANAGEQTCRVTVVTGMVEVGSSKTGKPVILRPEQQVVFEKSNQILTVRKIPENQPYKESWQAVSLVFDEVMMSEVAERLSLIFQVNIEFEDPAIKKQRLPEILEMVDALLGTTYQMEGRKILLRGEGCH